MNLSLISRYIRYYISAQTRHDVHSPFVYALIEVIKKKKNEGIFSMIEESRKKLENDFTVISDEDHGAGNGSNKPQTVSAVARSSSKSVKYAELLHSLVRHFKPGIMLELGTCFGISALYQASGNPEGRLITLEGNEKRATIAMDVIRNSGITNIEIVKGRFETTLREVLSRLPSIDYVFIDGNHQLHPTLSYFELCLEKSHNETVFIFDDINWSEEMQQAWEKIKTHHRTRVTVDLFMMGIVFLNPELSKQDFTVRF